MDYILIDRLIYVCLLYIAINISRITVDKYSCLLTVRGTSAPFSPPRGGVVGASGPEGPTWVEEETLNSFSYLV